MIWFISTTFHVRWKVICCTSSWILPIGITYRSINFLCAKLYIFQISNLNWRYVYILTSKERRSRSRLKVHISRHVSSWIPSFLQQVRRSSWRGNFGVRLTPTVIFVVLLPKSFSALQKYLKYSFINVSKSVYDKTHFYLISMYSLSNNGKLLTLLSLMHQSF